MSRGQNFFFRTYNVVRRVPKGKVATYGQIAALVGNPHASQAVGWALRALKPNTAVPWQRVLNKNGMISIENMHTPKIAQVQLLWQEGVEVIEKDGNFWVDLKTYGWKATL